MDITELKNSISSSCGFIVLDDKRYDPIEIVLFADGKKPKGLPRNICEVSDDGRKRMVRIISLSGTGIKSLCKKNLSKGLSDDDRFFLWLFLAFGYTEKESWLRNNIVEKVMEDNGFSDKSSVFRFFVSYAKKRKIKLKTCRNSELIPEIKKAFCSLSVKTAYLKGRVEHRLMRAYFTKKYKKYWNKGENEVSVFIKRLKEEGGVEGKLSILETEGLGNSGCRYFTDDVNGTLYFIKGNEMDPIRTVRNECNVQRYLKQNNAETELFRLMHSAAKDGSWIKYLNEPWDTLDYELTEGSLTTDKLDRLGDFLVKAVDELYRLNVIHMDFRSANIMVMKEKGVITGFRLFDFGASSIAGAEPWDCMQYEGKYLIDNVCGKNRYNERIVDDAASALNVYMECGGRPDDNAAAELRSRIGRLYFVTKKK